MKLLLGMVRTGLIAAVVAVTLLGLPGFAPAVGAEDDEEPFTLIAEAVMIDEDEDEDDGEVIETVLVADAIVDPPVEPEPEIDEELPELGEPVAMGGVHIRKFWCDDDYDGDYGALAAACTTEGATTFTVEALNGEQEFVGGEFEAEVGTPGNVAVSEHLPEGYGMPVVFCSLAPVIGGEPVEYFGGEPVWYSDADTGNEFATIEIDLDAGWYLWCDWFNVPFDEVGDEGDEGGSIVVHKWACPAEFDPLAADQTDYQTECTEPMNGVVFVLVTEADEELVETTGEDGTDGEAVWTGVGAGVVSLSEIIPDGFGDPVVYCGWGAIYDNGEGGGAIAIDGIVPPDGVVGGVLEKERYPNEQMSCDWYNIPVEDDGSITVNKWTCPVGYNLDDPWADPASDCTDATNDVIFTLRHEGMADLDQATGDIYDGSVFWGDLGGGDYQIDESNPYGYVAILVTCTWSEDLGPYAYDTFDPGDEANITVGLAQGDELVCDWYNVPVEDEDEDGGQLTVIKYWCDGAVYSPDACELYGGVDFQVENVSGLAEPIAFTIGDDGTYTIWLTPGAYVLDELFADWCHAESDDVDGDGNVVVSDGYESVVEVYNCGPEDDDGDDDGGDDEDFEVTKLPNTGAGPMTAHGAAAPTMVLSSMAALIVIGLIARTAPRLATRSTTI